MRGDLESFEHRQCDAMECAELVAFDPPVEALDQIMSRSKWS